MNTENHTTSKGGPFTAEQVGAFYQGYVDALLASQDGPDYSRLPEGYQLGCSDSGWFATGPNPEPKDEYAGPRYFGTRCEAVVDAWHDSGQPQPRVALDRLDLAPKTELALRAKAATFMLCHAYDLQEYLNQRCTGAGLDRVEGMAHAGHDLALEEYSGTNYGFSNWDLDPSLKQRLCSAAHGYRVPLTLGDDGLVYAD